jgi:hypothetical protein
LLCRLVAADWPAPRRHFGARLDHVSDGTDAFRALENGTRLALKGSWRSTPRSATIATTMVAEGMPTFVAG